MACKRYLGKPMSHWEHEAKKLVVEILVRGYINLDTRSIIGELASKRLMELANAENPETVKEVLETRARFAAGMAAIINDITEK